MFIYVLTMFLRSWNRLCFNVVSVLSCWRFQWYWIYFQQHSNLWHWGKGNKEITRTLQVWGLRVLPWVCIGILTVYRFKWPDSQRRVMDELDSDIKRSHKGDEVKVIARTGSSSQKNLVGHQEGWGPMDGYILSKVILMMVEACGAMASPDHWYCISNKQWLHLYTCTYIYIDTIVHLKRRSPRRKRKKRQTRSPRRTCVAVFDCTSENWRADSQMCCHLSFNWIEGEEHALRLLVQLVKLSSRKFGRIAGTVTTEGKWWGRERGATRAGLFPVLDALYHLNPLKELLARKRRKPRMGRKMLRSQQRHLNSAI